MQAHRTCGSAVTAPRSTARQADRPRLRHRDLASSSGTSHGGRQARRARRALSELFTAQLEEIRRANG